MASQPVQLSYFLFSFSFILFFSIFICLLDKTETPLTHINSLSLSLPCAAASPSTHSLPLPQSIVTAARYQSTQGQIPHHHRWCLPLWNSPRLTLSLSLSSGFLCFLLLSSPAMAELLLPLTPIAVGGASHRRHNHWWLRVQLSYSLFSFSFILFFSIFICLLDKTETPLTLILFHFFISLMNKILFQFWLAWWMGFLVWISGISNNCYYWHF